MKLPQFLALALLCICLILINCRDAGKEQKPVTPSSQDALEQPSKGEKSKEKPNLKSVPKRSKTEEAIQKKKKKSAIDTLKPKTA